ncbi:MAG: amidohydrolase [Bacillota bacterium]
MTKKLFYNGYIYTMDEKNPTVKNVLVEDDKIISFNVEVQDEYQLIDLNGKTLLPGFNDSHMHALSYGMTLDMVDLNNVNSIEEIISEVSNFIENKDPAEDEWIFGRGWNHENFTEKIMPTRYDLDKISTSRPIVLTRTCGHLLTANSAALEKININSDTYIEGGKIDIDDNGVPTGIFAEKAMDLIYENMPSFSVEDIKNYLIKAGEKLRKKGITFVQTDDLDSANVHFQKVMQAYYELADENKLPIKFNLQLRLKTPAEIKEFLDNNLITYYDDFLTLGPLKVLADGSLGARTAALRESYADEENQFGELVYGKKKLYNLSEIALKNGLQIACHAIGDRTVALFIDIMEQLQKRYGKGLRNRIIHCQITDYDLLEKMAELNLEADIQPPFTATDWSIVSERIGKDREIGTYAWKSMLDLGINAAGGSDCPVENPDPIWGIACAVTRMDKENKPDGGWQPWEKLTVQDALKLYTKNAAYNCFMENQIGQIKKNYKADFVILDKNPFLTSEKEIKNINVAGTSINGNLYWN